MKRQAEIVGDVTGVCLQDGRLFTPRSTLLQVSFVMFMYSKAGFIVNEVNNGIELTQYSCQGWAVTIHMSQQKVYNKQLDPTLNICTCMVLHSPNQHPIFFIPAKPHSDMRIFPQSSVQHIAAFTMDSKAGFIVNVVSNGTQLTSNSLLKDGLWQYRHIFVRLHMHGSSWSHVFTNCGIQLDQNQRFTFSPAYIYVYEIANSFY